MAWRRPILLFCIATIVLGIRYDSPSRRNYEPNLKWRLIDFQVRDQRTTGGGNPLITRGLAGDLHEQNDDTSTSLLPAHTNDSCVCDKPLQSSHGRKGIDQGSLEHIPANRFQSQPSSGLKSSKCRGQKQRAESQFKGVRFTIWDQEKQGHDIERIVVYLRLLPSDLYLITTAHAQSEKKDSPSDEQGTSSHVQPKEDDDRRKSFLLIQNGMRSFERVYNITLSDSCPFSHRMESTDGQHTVPNTFTPKYLEQIAYYDPGQSLFEKQFGTSTDTTWSGRQNDTVSRQELEMSIVSICASFFVVLLDDDNHLARDAMVAILEACSSLPTVGEIVKAIMEGSTLIETKSETICQLEKEIKKMLLVWQPILPGVKTEYFNHQASLSALCRPRKSAVPGFDLEKDTNGKKCGRCVNNRSQSRCGGNHTASQPREYTVYPAAFLPSAGSSPTEAMSFLGYRLASLNSLPASCNVSRIRLAEAGFYYDNSKTSRNATNVHELACFSCGVAYAGWKNGDNPTAVHRQIKPDCPHVQTLPATPAATTSGYNTTAQSASTSLGGGASGSSWSSGPTSADSGYSSGSMHQSSIPESSFESTSSRFDNGSSARQSPHTNHAQPSIGPQSVDVPDSGMYSDSGRSYASDLATDAAGIAPPPLTNDGRLAPSQAGRFAPARDSIYTNHSSPRDTSGARVQDFEDRPPLVMSQAVYPQFSRQQERRATFTNWPLNHCFHPDDLVMQGFYYAGYADCIRCFYCGVGLKSWDERDDVMKEHIRWRPSCGYILNTKGRQFVGQIQQELRTQQANATNIQNSNIREETTTATTTAAPRPVSPPRNVNTVMSATAATAQMDFARPNASTTTGPATTAPSSSASSNASAESHAPSSSSSSSAAGGNAGNTSREVLRKVEEMGFSKNSIARAVRHLQQIGQSKVTADGLVETILNIVEDDNYQTDSVPATEGASASADEVPDRAQRIMAENQRLRTRQICRMCNNARVGMIFLPCGHVLACTTCGSTTRSCPNCGEFIRATANIFLS